MVCVALLALTVLLDYYYTPPFSNRIDWHDYEFLATATGIEAPYSTSFPNRGNGNVYAFLHYRCLCIRRSVPSWPLAVPRTS